MGEISKSPGKEVEVAWVCTMYAKRTALRRGGGGGGMEMKVHGKA